MRARGLKHQLLQPSTEQEVAPHAGAWIETTIHGLNHMGKSGSRPMPRRDHFVTGAWIETADGDPLNPIAYVAPHAGAWIETSFLYSPHGLLGCRAPCGRVD